MQKTMTIYGGTLIAAVFLMTIFAVGNPAGAAEADEQSG